MFKRIPNEFYLSDLGTSLGVVDFSQIPFSPRRIYWISGMTVEEPRGFHAHRKLNQVLVVQQGRVKLDLYRGAQKSSFNMSSNENHIYIPAGSWREIRAIEENSTILVVADQVYDESDYIRSWEEYLKWFTKNGELQ